MPTALIVDDHPGFQAAARGLLELMSYTVVGAVGTGEAGVSGALRLKPDLVLLDISLPDMSGFEVVRRLGAAQAKTAIVLTSNRDTSDVARRARRTHARGFIPKEELSPQTLRQLLAGTS